MDVDNSLQEAYESKIPNTLSELVKSQIVQFQYYTAGKMYYSLFCGEHKYTFPIDIRTDEWINSTLMSYYKPITLMRWIRKAISSKELRWEKIQAE